MLFWQDGSFLGLETQIDPFSISGYMLALLAMLLQELRKNMLVGSAESKTKIQFVGSMLLCQLSIVGHCCPLYHQGLCYPHCWVLQARNSLLQENIDPDTSPGVCVIPTCNATAQVL